MPQATSSKNPAIKKSLSNWLFGALFAISFFAIIVTGVAVCAISYASFESAAEEQLLSQTRELASAIAGAGGVVGGDAADTRGAESAEGTIEPATSENTSDVLNILRSQINACVRITYVAKDGIVLFDSYANALDMENHNTRPEIASARESHEATLQRFSDTLNTDTLYAAILVGDNCVLRLSSTRASLAAYLGGMWVWLAAALVCVTVLAFALSRLMTRIILRPLQKIDIQSPLDSDAYIELQPLLLRVDEQRKTLEQQNKELQQSVELRREFTSNVSHEMKTPLQVIGGYAELIEGGVASTQDIPKFAGLIRAEAETMRMLIDDVLTLSRLDEAALARESVNMNTICEVVCARLSHAAQKRNIKLKFSGMPGAQTNVLGNANSLEQMVYNLVDNAVKYSEDNSSVFVGLSLVESGAGDGSAIGKGAEDAARNRARQVPSAGTDSAIGKSVVLSVADSGCGIPDDAKARVFERFYRVDASRSRDTGGTGLGLAIVKHAAEQAKGRVRVINNHPKGTIFQVELPLFVDHSFRFNNAQTRNAN